jgi:serine/tyrosine/threonine adenylyltransferase
MEAGLSDEQRREIQEKVNPVYIPRQHLLQIAIEAAEEGDYSELHQLMSVLEKPFTEQEGMEKYSSKPPAEMVRPGISMLSCSS